MAAHSNVTFLQLGVNSGARWSSYYAGYLVLCCTRGVSQYRLRRDSARRLKQAQALHYLVTSGADMLSPQLSCIDIGTSRLLFVPRPPLAEYWLFIIRLLLECDENLTKRTQVARFLAGILLKRQLDHESEVVWSVCSRSKLGDLLAPTQSVMLEGIPPFWVVLKMSIAYLRMFALSCIVSAERHCIQVKLVPSNLREPFT